MTLLPRVQAEVTIGDSNPVEMRPLQNEKFGVQWYGSMVHEEDAGG